MALSGWLRRLQEIYSRLGAPAGASVSADLAALQADLGNPSARANLQTIEAMLGNPDAAAASLDGIIRTGYGTSAIARNIDGAVLERLEALLQGLPFLSYSFVEYWQDETGIPARWGTSLAGTGTATWDGSEAGYLKVLLNLPAVGGGDGAVLRSLGANTSPRRYPIVPGQYGTNTTARRVILEWEAKITTSPTRFDNTRTVIGGFTIGGSFDRLQDNQVSFILNADDLASLTDNGGVETLNAIAGLTLTNWNKYRIEVYAGGVRFYVNEVLRQTHVTNLPNQSMYIIFTGFNDAGGADALSIGKIRVWVDVEPY